MSLKRIFKFSKPKNPGYGISKSFYLSVLAGHAQLPSPDEVANPDGARGAVVAFLAPLQSGATKEDLTKPITRGTYALASKDRTTVIRMTVVSKDEIGFDPEAITGTALASVLAPETLARIRATWTLIQLTFESHHAMVAPALSLLYAAARRLAELTEGVVADPISQLYLLPNETPVIVGEAPLRAIDVISVRLLAGGEIERAVTLGLQKFGFPEFELRGFGADDRETASALLLSVSQTLLAGKEIEIGESVGSPQAPLDVAPGGIDRELGQGPPMRELIPSRGKSISECLQSWADEQR